NRHLSKKQLADQIVATVHSLRGYDAAVIGDDGKVIAGNESLASAALSQPGFFGPGPAVGYAMRLPGMPGPPPGEFGTFGMKPIPQPQFGVVTRSGFGPPGDVMFQRGPLPMSDGSRQPSGAIQAPPPNSPWAVQIFSVHRPGSGPETDSAWRSPVSFVHIDGATVVFTRSSDFVAGILSRSRWLAIGFVALTFALTLFVAERLLRSAMRPFAFVRSALTRLGEGDYSRLSVADREDPVTRELVEAYNAAAGEVASTAAQRREVEDNFRRFVADAGHELRTPLAVITGYVDLLRHAAPKENGMEQRIFAEIDGQSERMRVLIQNLLFLLRLDSQEPSDVKILDAADVVQGVVDSFQSLSNGSSLRAEVESGAFVQMSEAELRQAVGNLIDNALKYAPGSHIVARVRADGDRVVLSVSDDGPGMSPATRAHAFERFARGDTSGSIPGSGLGLAIVARTAERAGGTVSLQTEPGKGATVEMRVPAWRPRAASAS
ncbi:MAG: HAMP domain-containing histidine kinase, partial [Candidatus Eremiobacteraeota bacterium]|nr:HAMP domain-containing histidine kinase [Candidatus Eremiobacteraeota bacterium]